MACTLYKSENYHAQSVRGGGIVLTSNRAGREVFFQPGDDAQIMRDNIDALEEVDQERRDSVFDIVASQYF